MIEWVYIPDRERRNINKILVGNFFEKDRFGD
jgi:hypothetical protein